MYRVKNHNLHALSTVQVKYDYSATALLGILTAQRYSAAVGQQLSRVISLSTLQGSSRVLTRPWLIPGFDNKCMESAIANAIHHVRLPYRQVSVQVGLQTHKSWNFSKGCSLRCPHIVYPHCPGTERGIELVSVRKPQGQQHTSCIAKLVYEQISTVETRGSLKGTCVTADASTGAGAPECA